MTDLEITRLCAEAMGIEPLAINGGEVVIGVTPNRYVYRPLHDDAQAMALVRHLKLSVYRSAKVPKRKYHHEWIVSNGDDPETGEPEIGSANRNLNRAICLCVAQMQQAKAPREGGGK